LRIWSARSHCGAGLAKSGGLAAAVAPDVLRAEAHEHHCADAHAGTEPKRAAVKIHQRLRNRQSKARSLHSIFHYGARLDEWAAQFFHRLAVDALPIVLDENVN